MTISRRILLAGATTLGLPSTFFNNAMAAGPVRIRQGIVAFAQSADKVKAFRAAVDKMKKRSTANPDDPLGWSYWASVHGTDKVIPNGLQSVYSQCDHTYRRANGTLYIARHFISWHRAFLFFFEAALKTAAVDAGDNTSFELPYWNWYAEGTIPKIFTEGDAGTNPLWHDRVNNKVQALDNSAFDQKLLLPAGSDWRKSFSVPLEIDPHGNVHDQIGGEMGDVRTSARDPIFWLHHANIDRLWTSWIAQKGGVNPTDPNWLNQSWAFDKVGAMTMTADKVTDSAQHLKYRYDNYDIAPPVPAPPVAVAAAPAAAIQPQRVEVKGAAQDEATAKGAPLAVANSVTAKSVSATPGLSLGNAPVEVSMAMSLGSGNKLKAFALATPAAEITGAWIVIDGIEVGKDGARGGYSYAVKASLGDKIKSVKLTSLGSFMLSVSRHAHKDQQMAGADGKLSLSFPLKEVLEELGVNATTNLGSSLLITIEPAQAPVAGDPQFLKIGSISIQTTTAPLQ